VLLPVLTLVKYCVCQRHRITDQVEPAMDVVLEAGPWHRGASKPNFMVLASGATALAFAAALTNFWHHLQTQER